LLNIPFCSQQMPRPIATFTSDKPTISTIHSAKASVHGRSTTTRVQARPVTACADEQRQDDSARATPRHVCRGLRFIFDLAVHCNIAPTRLHVRNRRRDRAARSSQRLAAADHHTLPRRRSQGQPQPATSWTSSRTSSSRSESRHSTSPRTTPSASRAPQLPPFRERACSPSPAPASPSSLSGLCRHQAATSLVIRVHGRTAFAERLFLSPDGGRPLPSSYAPGADWSKWRLRNLWYVFSLLP
jgi:hypothetical protein